MSKDHLHLDGRPYTKEEFINRIKTDEKFAKKWGELGSIYGKQWRNWEGRIQIEPCKLGSKWEYLRGDSYVDNQTSIRQEPIDQIANLISELKTNPDSRRLMVNAWNVGELDQMVLPPCHYGFQMYTRELSNDERFRIAYKNLELRKKLEAQSKMLRYPDGHNKVMDNANIPTRAISLMWNQRSVDTFLGLPFNIASYGLLLELIAKAVGMVPEDLIGNLGDVHLYSNHIEQAKEQIDREPMELPTLKHLRSDSKYKLLTEFPILWDKLKISDFELENYQSHSSIKAPLSN